MHFPCFPIYILLAFCIPFVRFYYIRITILLNCAMCFSLQLSLFWKRFFLVSFFFFHVYAYYAYRVYLFIIYIFFVFQTNIIRIYTFIYSYFYPYRSHFFFFVFSLLIIAVWIFVLCSFLFFSVSNCFPVSLLCLPSHQL